MRASNLSKTTIIDAIIDMLALVADKGWGITGSGRIRRKPAVYNSDCPLVSLAAEFGSFGSTAYGGDFKTAWIQVFGHPDAAEAEALQSVVYAADRKRKTKLRIRLLAALGIAQ